MFPSQLLRFLVITIATHSDRLAACAAVCERTVLQTLVQRVCCMAMSDLAKHIHHLGKRENFPHLVHRHGKSGTDLRCRPCEANPNNPKMDIYKYQLLLIGGSI